VVKILKLFDFETLMFFILVVHDMDAKLWIIEGHYYKVFQNRQKVD